MHTQPASDLPSIADAVGPLLGRLPARQRPLLVALAERQAAQRYRAWARSAASPSVRTRLEACADREERIARRVEALYPDAPALQAELRAAIPELDSLGGALFDGRPVREQYAIQAAGERAGASTWRHFAKDAEPAARETFLACAELEEASAVVLDALLGEGGDDR